MLLDTGTLKTTGKMTGNYYIAVLDHHSFLLIVEIMKLSPMMARL